MYKTLIFIAFLIVFSSCNPNEKGFPNGVIEEEQMVEILTEVELTQAFVKLKMAEMDSINQEALYQNIFERYNVSQEKFNQSLKHYVTYPEILEDIYSRVIVRLSERQAETERVVESEKDSIE